MIYSGKKSVVLGLGASGEAAAILLAEEGSQVTALDSAPEEKLRERIGRLQAAGVRVIAGPEADSDPSVYDIAVLSPGIDPAVPLVQNILRKEIPVIGEIELAFEECACPVLAITGTNGKTTTTELTTAMLQGCSVRAISSGNIGIPFAQAVRESNQLDFMVLEVSSFQLETISAFRPMVAAWLNFSPNHLDRYRDLEEYRQAKLRIFQNQTPEDFAVVNARDPLPPLAARRITFSAHTPEADFTRDGSWILFRGERILDQSTTRLHGVHNAENLMAAMAMGYAVGIEFDVMASAMTEYQAPVHRCEFVRELDGVRWVNDSKATNLDAMRNALLSQEAGVVLIAGGKDKGFEFDPIADLVAERAKCAILIGEMRERIARSWPDTPCLTANSLEEAVQLARQHAEPGEVVLFSPGTSSFDMFRNYGVRGNRFKEAVHQLSPRENQKAETKENQ